MMRKTSAIVAIIFAINLLAGCATTQENQQMAGATLGALAAGLATGIVTGNVGAGIGAAIGGAAIGWGAVKLMQHESKQVRSAAEDRRLHGFAPPTNKVFIKLNKGYASPEIIKKGQKTTVYSDYSLSAPPSYGNQAEVTYTWTLKKDGQVITRSKPMVRTKTAAGHQTIQPINIPDNAEPGTYIVETRLSAGSAYDVNETAFVVQ